MRKITLTTLLLLALAAGAALAGGAVGSVGSMAPAFQLKDLDGKTHSLADYKGKVVVLEWLNPNCPFSDRHAREKTMSSLAQKYGQVAWLGINSTNASHRDFLQPAEHKAWAQKNGVTYTVLYDETGKVGKAYDAKTTPHMFIVDEQGKIAYNGAIDDDPSGRTAAAKRTNYVNGGLIAELAGKNVDPAATKPYGCSVKY
jgi:peroxiredoxin